MDIEPRVLSGLGLLAVGLVSGFINTVSGGGGLVAVPVLLFAGFTPAQALATNKLQLFFGPWAAITRLVDARLIDSSLALRTALFAFAGALAGAFVMGRIQPGLLARIVPYLLIAVTFYVLLLRQRDRDTTPRVPQGLFAILVGTLLGFYDGFFGPGVGSLWILCLTGLAGQALPRAAANATVFDLIGTVAALLVFAGSGQIMWSAGLAMGMGQLVGARLGATLIIWEGARWIRPLLGVSTCGAALRLLYQQLA
jgi:uncharacterized protein